MKRRIYVDRKCKVVLRETLRAIGTPQKDIAIEIGVSEGWLSQTFSPDGHSVDRELLELLIGNLRERLRDSSDPRREDLGDALLRIVNPQSPVDSQIISRPGGAVPLNARNYVSRDSDSEAFDCLESPHSPTFTMGVEGPIHSGKTSLLGRFAAAARDRNIEVVSFDCKLAAPPPTWDETDADRKRRSRKDSHFQDALIPLTRLMAEQISAAWGFRNPGRAQGIANFTNWLSESLTSAPDRARLLIVDDISALEYEVSVKLLQMMRSMHNDRSSGIMPLNLALGFSFVVDRSSYYWARSSTLFCEPLVHVEWFEPDDVATLLARLNVSLSASATKFVQASGGQPFLTHLAAVNTPPDPDMHEGLNDDQVVIAGLKKLAPNHCDMVRRILTQGKPEPPYPLLDLFLDVCGDGHNTGHPIPDTPLDFLKRSHLIEVAPDNRKLTPSLKLYEILAKDIRG
jgi:AAA-like domain